MPLVPSEMKMHLESVLNLLDRINDRIERFLTAQDLLLKERREEKQLVEAKRYEIARLIMSLAEEENKAQHRSKTKIPAARGTKRPALSDEEILRPSKRMKSTPVMALPQNSTRSDTEEKENPTSIAKSENGKMACRLCDTPVGRKNYGNHVTINHLGDFKAYQCRLCEYKNGKKFCVSRHIGSRHSDEKTDDSNIISLVESIRPKIHAKIAECFDTSELAP